MKVTSVEFVKSVVSLHDRPGQRLKEVAFAGRSNVGKSSLVNCLLNRKKMAKTSSTPGKTRQLNYFRINHIFYFVDLPGYGYAKVSVVERKRWQVLIEQYITDNQSLCGVISIIDGRIGPTKLDIQLLQWLNQEDVKSVVIATKVDKLSRSAMKRQVDKYTEELNNIVLPFSAVTGNGKKEVWREIENLME